MRGVGLKRVIWGVVVEIASLYIAGEMTGWGGCQRGRAEMAREVEWQVVLERKGFT